VSLKKKLGRVTVITLLNFRKDDFPKKKINKGKEKDILGKQKIKTER